MFIALAMALAGTAGEAQTGTADGVAAFVLGDYRQAAEVLRPLAETWPRPGDPVARFFLAMLYESGWGVPRSAVRACTLYGLAAFEHHRFVEQARILYEAALARLSPHQHEQCVHALDAGFDHGFQPVSFALEPDHWISFDLSATVIGYRGEITQHTPVGPGGGAVFLPLSYTRLIAGRSRSTPRHFVGVFAWVPDQTDQRWTLQWFLSEVVGRDLVHIAAAELLTSAAARPPTASIDLDSLVRLRVNDHGNAEFEVLGGPDAPWREGIPSEAERSEVEALERARREANERVDWKRVRDPDRAPELTYADSDGCGNLFVYGWSADRTEAITVEGDADALQLSAAPQMLRLGVGPGDVKVAVHVYDRPISNLQLCTDVIIREIGTRDPEVWVASGGAVAIELSPPGIRAREPHLARTTIRLVGAEFISSTGARVTQTRPIVLTGLIGTLLPP